MEAEIRPLDAEADAAGCDAVVRSLPYHFGDPGGVRECAEAVRTQRGLVAHDRGEIVGFATTAPASSQAAEITWLAVHTKRRGSGLGHRLVERIAAEAAHDGCVLLCALTQAASVFEPSVKDSYDGTRRFWRRLGFTPVKELALSDWPVTALLMIRPLAQTSVQERDRTGNLSRPRDPAERRSVNVSHTMPASQTPESVLQALARTLATDCARVEFEFAQQFPALPDFSTRRRGGVLGPLIRVGSTAGKRLFAAGLGKLARDLRGEGYIDFHAHRCTLDFGSYAMVVVGDRMWSGRSGRPVATLPDEPATSVEPMWLLDLVRGVTDVEAEGEELERGGRRRHLRVHADMSRAAAAAPAGLPVPIGAARYGDLLHLSLELWLDDEDYIRRLRQGVEMATLTLDLLELGAEGPADWTRLPTFRSPEEADLLARRDSD